MKKKITQNNQGGAGKQLGSETGSHPGYPPDPGSLHPGQARGSGQRQDGGRDAVRV